jgi:hypothetical protein
LDRVSTWRGIRERTKLRYEEKDLSNTVLLFRTFFGILTNPSFTKKRSAFQATAKRLASLFVKNFVKFESGVSKGVKVKAAGPKV